MNGKMLQVPMETNLPATVIKTTANGARHTAAPLLLASALVLAGCGGTGGEKTATPTPEPSPTPRIDVGDEQASQTIEDTRSALEKIAEVAMDIECAFGGDQCVRDAEVEP